MKFLSLALLVATATARLQGNDVDRALWLSDCTDPCNIYPAYDGEAVCQSADNSCWAKPSHQPCYAHTWACSAVIEELDFHEKCVCSNLESFHGHPGDYVCQHDDENNDSCYTTEGHPLACPSHTSPCTAKEPPSDDFSHPCPVACSNLDVIPHPNKVCLHDGDDTDVCYEPDDFGICPSHTTPCKAIPPEGDDFSHVCPTACSNIDSLHAGFHDPVCQHDNNDSCFDPEGHPPTCPSHTTPCAAIEPAGDDFDHPCSTACSNIDGLHADVHDPVCQHDGNNSCYDPTGHPPTCPSHTTPCTAIDEPDLHLDDCDAPCFGGLVPAGEPVCQNAHDVCWDLVTPCHPHTSPCRSTVYDPVH